MKQINIYSQGEQYTIEAAIKRAYPYDYCEVNYLEDSPLQKIIESPLYFMMVSNNRVKLEVDTTNSDQLPLLIDIGYTIYFTPEGLFEFEE